MRAQPLTWPVTGSEAEGSHSQCGGGELGQKLLTCPYPLTVQKPVIHICYIIIMFQTKSLKQINHML